MKKLKFLSLFALATSALTATAAVSQGQKFSDWTGACDDSGKNCGIVQVQNNDKNEAIARILIQKIPEAGNRPVMIISLPLGVNLQAGVGVAVDTKELARVPYDFCDPAGCHTGIPLQEDALKVIKAGGKMQIGVFVAGDQQLVEFSLKGITAGVNAL